MVRGRRPTSDTAATRLGRPDLLSKVRDREPNSAAMNHAVAVSTNNSKIVNVGLMCDCEHGKWFRVMTFDKTLSTVTVAPSKINDSKRRRASKPPKIRLIAAVHWK